MEATTGLIEPLLEKVEQYSKTNIALVKLKTVEKIATVTSSLISRFILIGVFSFFALMFSIGMAFYLGDLVGNVYNGFLIVSAFYALIGIILVLIKTYTKGKLNNLIIKQLLK